MRTRTRPERAGAAGRRVRPAVPSAPPVVLQDVVRTFGRREAVVHALDGVSVAFALGTFTAVMGPSGSGKSTLLQTAAGLDAPTSGRVLLGGTDLAGLGQKRLAELRRDRVGFVFQQFNLLPRVDACANVELPMVYAGLDGKSRRERALNALARVGLADRAHHRPMQLSGGQQQRVAIARALVGEPEVLFADEPTGALDSRAGRAVLALLRATTDAGRTLIMVTHDPSAAAWADRVVFLADGRLAGELTAPSAERVAERLAELGS